MYFYPNTTTFWNRKPLKQLEQAISKKHQILKVFI